LVSNDNNNNFKLPYSIFLEKTRYMTILTRQERERLFWTFTIRARQN
jgi:hypothetical protein